MTDARRKAKIRLLQRHLTFDDLAERSGLSKATVHNVLNGASSSRKSRQAITNALEEQLWPGVNVTARPYTMPVGMEFVFDTSEEAHEKAGEFAAAFGVDRAKVSGNRVRILKRTRGVIVLADEASGPASRLNAREASAP